MSNITTTNSKPIQHNEYQIRERARRKVAQTLTRAIHGDTLEELAKVIKQQDELFFKARALTEQCIREMLEH
jgi:hypothetical protein